MDNNRRENLKAFCKQAEAAMRRLTPILGPLEEVYEKLSVKFDGKYNPVMIRNWTRPDKHRKPLPVKDLSEFVLFCSDTVQLDRSMVVTKLNPLWVEKLFQLNGTPLDSLSNELKATLGLDVFVQELQVQRADTGYRKGLISWASKFFGASNYPVDLEKAYVHRSLQKWEPRKTTRARSSQPEIIIADELLELSVSHIEIVAPTGYGKSILWQYLTLKMSQWTESLSVLPIDWRQTVGITTSEDLIEAAIRRILPEGEDEIIQKLIRRLLLRLENGKAIALIDNADELQNGPNDAPPALQRWKRVISFRRNIPFPVQDSSAIYRLAELNDQEIQQFLTAWPSATGQDVKVGELLFKAGFDPYPEWPVAQRQLIRSPLFLDRMCSEIADGLNVQHEHRKLILVAISDYTNRVVNANERPDVFRVALGNLALYIYREAPLQKNGLSTGDILDFWSRSSVWKDDAKRFYELSLSTGLFREVAEDRYSFLNEVCQAYLAACAWTQYDITNHTPQWSTEIVRRKHDPGWVNVIIFTAMLLDPVASNNGGQNAFADLERFFDNLLDFPDSNAVHLEWLLAGRCMAALDQNSQERLARSEIGGAILQQLLSDLEHLTQFGLDCHEYERTLRVIQSRQQGHGIIERISDQKASAYFRQTLLDTITRIDEDSAINAISIIALDPAEPSTVRESAIGVLGRSRHPKALPSLRRLLEESDFTLAVFNALGQHNTLGAARMLWDSNFQYGLRLLTNADILPFLEEKLSAEAADKTSILTGIANVGGTRAVDILETFLKSEDETLFETAGSLLSAMELHSASDVLIKYLADAPPATERHLKILEYMQLKETWDVDRLIQSLLSLTTTNEKLARNIASAATILLINRRNIEVRGRLENLLRTPEMPGRRHRWLVSALRHLGSPEIKRSLLQDVQSSNDEIRASALSKLVELKHPNATGMVLAEIDSLLQAKRYLPQNLCSAVMKSRDSRTVPMLWRAFLEGDDLTARNAADTLIAMTPKGIDQQVAKQWTEWVTHDVLLIKRRLCLQILSALGTSRAIETLVGAWTNYRHLEPEANALDYLRRVDRVGALKGLVKAMSHKDEQVVASAYYALCSINDEKVVTSLISAQEKLPEYARVQHNVPHDNPKLRPSSGLPLWLNAEDFLARSVALMALRSKSIAREVASFLDSSEPSVRAAALVVLEQAPFVSLDDAALEALERVARSNEPWKLRQRAIKLLGIRGGPQVRNFLVQLLKDTHKPAQRDTIAEALLLVGANFDELGLLSDQFVKNAMAHLDHFEAIPPRYLCGLIRNLPVTRAYLIRACLDHDIRVTQDGNIVLSSGVEVSCEDAEKWLERKLKWASKHN